MAREYYISIYNYMYFHLFKSIKRTIIGLLLFLLRPLKDIKIPIYDDL